MLGMMPQLWCRSPRLQGWACGKIQIRQRDCGGNGMAKKASNEQQKVEHYEMAAYGSVRTWAQQLGQKEIADLLQQTLDEEGETDHKLTQMAGKINSRHSGTRPKSSG